jgi:hypothetical protein
MATMLPIPLPVMAATLHSVPAAPEAAKQQPRQQKQPCSLPEGDDTYMKQGWQYAIPKQHYQAAEGSGTRYCQ